MVEAGGIFKREAVACRFYLRWVMLMCTRSPCLEIGILVASRVGHRLGICKANDGEERGELAQEMNHYT